MMVINPMVNSNDNYLSHHGILGMKWGVRRYQNKDGTLTAAGRKRKAKELKKSGYKDPGSNLKKASEEYSKEVKKRLSRERENVRKAAIQMEKDISNYNKNLKNGDSIRKKELYKQADRSVKTANALLIDLTFKNVEVANEFVMRFNTALVEDLGFENLDKGLKWLNKNGYGISGVDISNNFTPDIERKKNRR